MNISKYIKEKEKIQCNSQNIGYKELKISSKYREE